MMNRVRRIAISVRRRLATFYHKSVLKSCEKGTVFDVRVSLYQPSNISFGMNCTVNEGVVIQSCELSKVEINNNVTLSYRCMILTGGLDIGTIKEQKSHVTQDVIVEDNVWIGAGAIILPGVTLFNGCIISAGSVVTKDVAKDTLVGGNPAKVIRILSD